MQLLKPKVENPIKFAHPCIYTHTYRYILRRCTQYYTHKPRGQVRFSREPLAARSGESARSARTTSNRRVHKPWGLRSHFFGAVSSLGRMRSTHSPRGQVQFSRVPPAVRSGGSTQSARTTSDRRVHKYTQARKHTYAHTHTNIHTLSSLTVGVI